MDNSVDISRITEQVVPAEYTAALIALIRVCTDEPLNFAERNRLEAELKAAGKRELR